MPAHLLANSAFAGIDIFNSSSSSLSKPLVPVQTIRKASVVPQLDAARRSSVALPDQVMSVATPVIPGRSTSLGDDVLLNSPNSMEEWVSHATTVDMAGEARRGQVQLMNVENWARPLVVEAEEREYPTCLDQVQADSTGLLFGQSAQRMRRLNKPSLTPPELDSPSASSSDDEVLPPTPGITAYQPGPFAQGLAGLGMNMRSCDMTIWSQKHDVARKIHSLPNGAPATLEELRQLKSAAQQLENEVRGRIIMAPSDSPLVAHQSLPSIALPSAPIDIMRSRRIRRKAVPTIVATAIETPTVQQTRVFTLDVAPLPDTPRSHASSSMSYISGPFDLSTGSSSSDADSTPPLTPPHSLAAFPTTLQPIRASSSESSGLRRSAGVHAGLTVSPSLPLYIPSVHGDIDGWWSSSDDEHGDASDDAADADVDSGSDISPSPNVNFTSPPKPTYTPLADGPVRRAPGFHMRSVSDDTSAPAGPTRKSSFYGNKTAFMSTFFSKSPSPPSTPSKGAKTTAPSAWSGSASPAAKASRRASMQFFPSRSPSISVDDHDEAEEKEAQPKKSFYANSKAFRSVRDLGAMRWGDKDKEKAKEKTKPQVPEAAGHKRGLSRFFRKMGN